MLAAFTISRRSLAVGAAGLVVVWLLRVGVDLATAPEGTPSDEPIPVETPPLQGEIPEEENASFGVDRAGLAFLVTPKATFRIAARVLHTERYWSGPESDLSPLDLAVGWEEMSDPDLDEWISWSQSNRWYYWQWESGSPYKNNFIAAHSANIHIVPANENLSRAARRIDEDDHVLLEGRLVVIQCPTTGFEWKSSLSRNDSGKSSCELLYLERIVRDGVEYR